jgi:4-amino-4-deoxy-L-arabinose transferase-like glycosyltransferase
LTSDFGDDKSSAEAPNTSLDTSLAASADAPAKNSPLFKTLSGGKNFSQRHWRPLLIFFLALAARLLYTQVILEHRICHFGDAFYYLSTGSKLLALVTSGGSIASMVHTLVQDYNRHASMMASVLSLSLPDRLIIDGPVYPAYLAFVQFLLRISPQASAQWDGYCLQLGFANSLLDTATCLVVYYVGRLAFTRKQALVAGLMYALYPPAIINTQHCYSEPFAGFLLALWMAVVLKCCWPHDAGTRKPVITFALLGLLSGLLILAKPLFFFLPPMVALAFFVAARGKISVGGAKLAALAFGLAVVVIPWVMLTHAITGNYMLLVSRTPSYNVYAGNQVATDGWRVWPAENIPAYVSDAVSIVAADARSHPLRFAALEFKKIPRLWAGVWNENQFSLFGLKVSRQTLIHQMLLFLGFTGLCLLLACEKKNSRAFYAAILFASVIALHFMYVAFEPISRYNETAMSCVILAAAYAACVIWQLPRNRRLSYLATAALFLYLLARKNVFNTWFAGVIPVSYLYLVPALDALTFVIFWLVAARAVYVFVVPQAMASRKLFLQALLALSFGVAIISSVANTLTDESWHEWTGELSQRQTIKQEIYLPAATSNLPASADLQASTTAVTSANLAAETSAAPVSFVLIDMQSPVLLPRLTVAVNDHLLTYPPMPWMQANPVSAEAVQLLGIQGQAMGRDLRSFRQWWAYAVPTSYLKFGQINKIVISSDTPDLTTPVKIFGDYTKLSDKTTDGKAMLPSLDTLSWTKGFASFDHRDPRVYNQVNLAGKTISSVWYDGFKWQRDDLSPVWGKQFGRYRIFFAVANKNAQATTPATEDSAAPVNIERVKSFPLLNIETARGISGSDPASMVITPKPISLPENLPADTLFLFQTEIKSLDKGGNAFISVDFHGLDNNQAAAWNSAWQPACVHTTSDWRSVCIADFIPERVLRWQNLQVSVLVSPFCPDQLYLKRKQALKASAAIRNTGISFMPPLALPPPADLKWRIY